MVSKKGERQAVLLTKAKRGENIVIGVFAMRQKYIYIYPSCNDHFYANEETYRI